MNPDAVERRIAMLRKSMEARQSPKEREYRTGAVKFSDAIIELMAYLKKEQLDKGQDSTDRRSTTAAGAVPGRG